MVLEECTWSFVKEVWVPDNSLENVAILSDGNAYAVKAVPVLNIDKIYYKSLDTYFGFVIIFPITIMSMFIVVCFKGARLQLRVKLSNPKYSSSFAALVTVGMLFSYFCSCSRYLCTHLGI